MKRALAIAILLFTIVALVSCQSQPTPTPAKPAPTAAPVAAAPTAVPVAAAPTTAPAVPTKPASPAAPTAAPTATKPAVINLNVGTTPSGSGAYANCIAIGNVINRVDKGLNLTMITSSGGSDNLSRVREGNFDLAFVGGWDMCYEAMAGTGNYKGKPPMTDVRLMFLRSLNAQRLYVRTDSKVTKWADLAGKRFVPGGAGTTTEILITRASEAVGVPVELWPASMADAKKGISEGKLVGFGKASSPLGYDPAALEIHVQNPLSVIGWSDAEVAKVQAKYPTNVFWKTTNIKEAPGTFWELYITSGAFATTKVSEDVIYRITKIVDENWTEISKDDPTGTKLVTPLKDYFKWFDYVPKGAEVPFHAGVIRYAKEKGYAVPDRVIPPEYKPK